MSTFLETLLACLVAELFIRIATHIWASRLHRQTIAELERGIPAHWLPRDGGQPKP